MGFLLYEELILFFEQEWQFSGGGITDFPVSFSDCISFSIMKYE